MSFSIRESVKVLLFNGKNELLLLCADDPKTTAVTGEYYGRFWFPVGGKIEAGETLEQAALREIYEETGIEADEIELGQFVWFGEFDLIFSDELTRVKQKFIVAKTKQTNFSLVHLTDEEQAVVQKAAWFSVEELANCKEVIFPVLLPHYLPDIIAGKYPERPIEIDLGKKPSKRSC